MGKSGTRMRVLGAALQELGYRPASERIPAPRLATLPDKFAAMTLSLYRELGGLQADPTLRPGAWDMTFDNGLVVELDEQLHFNRYRAITLESLDESLIPWVGEYRNLVHGGEARCLSDSLGMAGKWSSPGSVALFGPAAVAGDFSGNGSPRWKQRALYDFMKDAAAAAGQLSLVRLSIYDVVGETALDDALEPKRPALLDLDALSALIARRTSVAVCSI